MYNDIFALFADACSYVGNISLWQDHFYEIEAHYEKHDPILNVEIYDYDILSSDDLIGEAVRKKSFYLHYLKPLKLIGVS